MILLCPNCGHHLPSPLVNGIASCTNCHRVFESSRHNILLSGAWLVRKFEIGDKDRLIHQYGFSEEDAEFVIQFAFDLYYSHEDFKKLLSENAVVKKAS